MKSLTLSPLEINTPKIHQITTQLQDFIRQGILKPHDALPSLRVLAQQWQVHRNTVHLALSELVAQGWLVNQPYKGFVVAQWVEQYVALDKIKPCKIDPIVDTESAGRSQFDLRSGVSDLRLFDIMKFKRCYNQAFTQATYQDLDYRYAQGVPQFRAVLGEYLRRVRGITTRELLITNGSQESLFILSQLLLQPGDYAAMPELTYPDAKRVFELRGARILPIALDREGLNMDSLEQQLQQYPIKLLYTTPQHQYPTTVTLPLVRRLKLLALAEQYNFYIIEDDYDHELHFVHTPPLALASADQYDRIFYLSSFTKILLPAIRVGFISSPQKFLNDLCDIKTLISRRNEPFAQMALTHWIQCGEFERQLRRTIRQLRQRRQVVIKLLQHYQPQLGFDFIVPDGGVALWLNMGQKTPQIITCAKQHNILLMDDRSYAVQPKQKPNGVRLAFAKHTEKELTHALQLLFTGADLTV